MFRNPATFVTLYAMFALPTYVLPYLGSNSWLVNAAFAIFGVGINPFFWLHLLCLLALAFVSWRRGASLNRDWLGVMPVLALAFDLAPLLNVIPLVPSALHMCTLLAGILEEPKPADKVIDGELVD